MKKFIVFWMAIAMCTGTVMAQQPDTLIRKLDSLNYKADSAGGQINNTSPRAYNEVTQFTPSSFLILQWSNLKQSFTKPFHMTGQDWVKLGKFAVVLGAASLIDEPLQRQALDLREHNRGLRVVSTQVTNFGGPYEGYTLAALGAYGFIFNNKKMQTTTLLAVQSYITGAAVESALKFLSGRQRPYVVNPKQVEAEPTFHGPFVTMRDAQGNKLNSSFPSGHTTVAFAAATVYAMEYKDRPWVPVFAYTAASLIGLSRITQNAHWATDVIAGAALGYLTGRQVVNNYHRYAKLKAPKQPRNSVSFSLGYSNGQLMPSMVYRF
ncbi:MAG TPA: phosphatase PAP2 family protein [Flavisolibacter sp.]|nr:phosphatase PAP2 family protein [Flavisolibacter sp.]